MIASRIILPNVVPGILCLALFVIPWMSRAEPVVIEISGGVGHSLHGIGTIKETLFGENWGSGGSNGADKINATWFRSTSACNITRKIEESPSRPGFADPALAKKYPSNGVNIKRNSVKMVRLFHVKANKRQAAWPPRPFTGRKGNESQAKAWAEICAAYVAHAMRPYSDGSIPETMWEFGNEMMWHHYLNTPAYKMDPNRQGPSCNGANAAFAYRQWVDYAAKAIKKTVPHAYIMAGSGDMITYSGDWWGWKFWDKPLLDRCVSNIDAYNTHWYSTVPEQMIIEAALIHNYTSYKYHKGIPTHVTEFSIPNIGAASPKNQQWCRTRYDAAMLFAALRDPDKIAGLYRFIYSDPRWMPKFQIKGSILETWLKLTRELRGMRLLTKSSSDKMKTTAIQTGESIVALVYNDGSRTRNIEIALTAPKNAKITKYTIATLGYNASDDKFQQTEKKVSFDTAKSSIAIPAALTTGSFAVVTAVLNAKGKLDKVVRAAEFIPNAVLIPAGDTIKIKISEHSPKKHAMLRLSVENSSSRWSDLWVDVNEHLYQAPTKFWRRPCRRIEIPINPEHVKRDNTIVVHAAPNAKVTVITAALEMSDAPMSASSPAPRSAAPILVLPNNDLSAGKTYPITIRFISVAPRRTARAATFYDDFKSFFGLKTKKTPVKNNKLTLDHFTLPENWKAVQIDSTPNAFRFNLTIPQNAVVDWYPVTADIALDGERYTIGGQVRVNSPVQCLSFAKPPAIDGRLDEWEHHPEFEILTPINKFETLVWTPGHRRFEKTGKTISVGWRKDGFYFSAIFTAAKPVGAWLDMFFDLNADRTFGHWDRNDQQFKITLSKDGEGNVKQIVWGARAPHLEINPQPGSKIRWFSKNNTIQVEGFIPTNAFHIFAPREYPLIGFDFRINNKIQWYSRSYEQVVNQFPITKSWGREQVTRNPSLWGWLEFIPAAIEKKRR